jgi:hypothetical protein
MLLADKLSSRSHQYGRAALWPSSPGTDHAQVAEVTKRARLLATHRAPGACLQAASSSSSRTSFLFLGPARYVTHHGGRPIAITWQLDHPMPADFFARAQVLAG